MQLRIVDIVLAAVSQYREVCNDIAPTMQKLFLGLASGNDSRNLSPKTIAILSQFKNQGMRKPLFKQLDSGSYHLNGKPRNHFER